MIEATLRGTRAVRGLLRCARRGREPYQGMSARPVRRPALDRDPARQPTPPVVRLGRLCADACLATHRTGGYRAGAGLCDDDSITSVEDWHCRHRQRPAGQARDEQHLPEPAGVHRRLPCLERRGALSRPHETETFPRHSPHPRHGRLGPLVLQPRDDATRERPHDRARTSPRRTLFYTLIICRREKCGLAFICSSRFPDREFDWR